MATAVSIVGPSYHLNDRKAAVQSAINCRPQRTEGTTYIMSATPGEALNATLSGEIRNFHDVEGRFFCVASNVLYELVANVWTSRGSIASNSGFVGMAHNASQLVLVDGNTLNVYSLATNVLTPITVPGWRGSNDVVEIDGYMVFVAPGTEQFYLSKIDDSTMLNALDFSSADSSPDGILTQRVFHRQLVLLGRTSTEFWINTGTQSFPFARYQSYTMDIGVVGKRAAVVGLDTLFLIGQSRAGRGIVYALVGNRPQRVSTQAVEEALRASTDLSQATMWAYQVEGAEFIGIDAPGLATTWVFDAAIEEWHEEAEWAGGWQPRRSGLLTAYNGRHYAGDGFGNVTVLDSTLNTRNGRVIRRERTWPHLRKTSLQQQSYFGLELVCASGLGGTIVLEISNDGGFTFGPPLFRSLGATGRNAQLVRWLGLGTARDRVYRIWQTDPVPFSLHQAAMDYQ